MPNIPFDRWLPSLVLVLYLSGCENRSSATDVQRDANVADAASPADGGGHVYTVSPSPLAQRLIEEPTTELIALARADHDLRDEEVRLAVVAWACWTVAQQTRGLPTICLKTGLYERLLAVAAEYPRFFNSGPHASEPNAVREKAVASPLDFACDNDCTPAFPAEALTGLLLKLGAAGENLLGPSRELLRRLEAIYSAGKDIGELSGEALTTAELEKMLITIGSLVSGVLALSEIPVFVAIAAVFTMNEIGGLWLSLNELALDCETFKASLCCGTVMLSAATQRCCYAPENLVCGEGTECLPCEGRWQCVQEGGCCIPADGTGTCCNGKFCPAPNECLGCPGPDAPGQCLPPGSSDNECCGPRRCAAGEECVDPAIGLCQRPNVPGVDAGGLDAASPEPCMSYGYLCFGSDRAAKGVCSSSYTQSLIGVSFTYDGVVSSNSDLFGRPSSGRDLVTFDNWCPFQAVAPGTPPPDPAQTSVLHVAPFCGQHRLTVAVTELAPVQVPDVSQEMQASYDASCGPPKWPVTIPFRGVQWGSGSSSVVTIRDETGSAIAQFVFAAPGSQSFTAQFE